MSDQLNTGDALRAIAGLLLTEPSHDQPICLANEDPVNRNIEAVEADLLRLPQVECPLIHRFAPGVYARQITMPAGSFIIGHCHKTEHFNIVLSGRARVMMDGYVEDIIAPCIFVSQKYVRKVLRIDEEMVWLTIHPTNETDMQKLEAEIIEKSQAFTDHFKRLEQLQALPPAAGDTL